ncbi:hypothetical protein MACH05_00830 [Qipengyuania nanhaisediminis]
MRASSLISAKAIDKVREVILREYPPSLIKTDLRVQFETSALAEHAHFAEIRAFHPKEMGSVKAEKETAA